jgi:hypothetical protein
MTYRALCLIRSCTRKLTAASADAMIVDERQVAPMETVSQISAGAPGNLVISAAKRHPESCHLGSGEQLQRHPAGDLTTVRELAWGLPP